MPSPNFPNYKSVIGQLPLEEANEKLLEIGDEALIDDRKYNTINEYDEFDENICEQGILANRFGLKWIRPYEQSTHAFDYIGTPSSNSSEVILPISNAEIILSDNSLKKFKNQNHIGPLASCQLSRSWHSPCPV